MNPNSKIIFYYSVCARWAYSSKQGRKITSLIKYWKSMEQIDLHDFYGGDIRSKKTVEKFTKGETPNGYLVKKRRDNFVINTISELLDIFHDLKFYFHLNRQEINPQIIWERSSRFHWLTLVFAKRKKAIYIHECLDDMYALYGWSALKWWGRMVDRIKKKYADYLVVQNEVQKIQLIKTGIPSKKIKVAFNAVDTKIFKPGEKTMFPDHTFTIGYIGSFAGYHDMPRLVKAIQIIQKNFPEMDIKFVLVGNGEHYEETIEKIENLNLKNIQLVDPVPIDEVPFWINQMDLCVLPGSTDIICPIKIMEFMACAKPVLLPDYPCNREVIADDLDGLFFEPFNENDLAKKIVWAFSNPKKVQNIGQRALASCQDKFTWQATWGKVLMEIIKQENLV